MKKIMTEKLIKERRFKGLIVIMDGLGDRPCEVLKFKTPLEYADTPFLDKLAKNNVSGLMDPLAPGIPVDTHTGVGILFGMPPTEACALARGPIEAAGINLEMQPGDIMFRGNFCTLEKETHAETHAEKAHKITILDRRAGRINHGTEELCANLKDIPLVGEITGSLFPATHHRCVVRLRGAQLTANITDTDPGGNSVHLGVQRSKAMCYDADVDDCADADAMQTSAAINQFSDYVFEHLDKHPINQQRREAELPVANGVIVRGGGMVMRYKNILEKLALKVAVIASESTILGLGNLFSFTTITDKKFTALVDTDVQGKVDRAMETLKTHDLVYIHIKGTDSAAHDHDPIAKAEIISRVDKALSQHSFDNIVVGVCADHSTDSFRGEHNGDPVPILIHNPLGRRDQVKKFSEYHCTQGALSRITAHGFLISVLDAMGYISNFKSGDFDLHSTVF